MKLKRILIAVLMIFVITVNAACSNAKQANVTFVFGNDVANETVTVQVGEKLSQPNAPEVSGYEIEGWYSDEGYADDSKWNFDTDTVAGDISLYANWVEAGGANNGDNSDNSSADASNDASNDVSSDGSSDSSTDADVSADIPSDVSLITVKQAIEIANALGDGEVTEQRYYLRATVVKISNPNYGEMTISDGTGEIYVYGSYSADGSVGYASMESKPYGGDEVYISTLIQNYKGSPELKSVWILDFTPSNEEISDAGYTKMTVSAARTAKAASKIKLTGVVAQITYANGKIPSGFILVDNTSSIYVYDGQAALRVKVGNTVTVIGEKTWWILSTEESNAKKFGYAGCCQLENASIISNDEKVSDFNKSWITETTVKEIMDTPVSTDITTKIFKVNALVKKAPGNGFINYYIDDIDGETGSYVYTQCNGGDFDWLDQFDGKICTVYLTAINAKSSGTGCVWRFLPVKVVDEGYKFDPADAAKFAVEYYALSQFLTEYAADPAKTLISNVDSELLGISGIKVSYSSSDENVAYVSQNVFHTKNPGEATITITASYGSYAPYSKSVKVKVSASSSINSISVSDAIKSPVATSDSDKITVRGIVGPSLVNQAGGFYLIDDTGVIAVKFSDSKDISLISIGDEVVITGKRDAYGATDKCVGEICITSATLEQNLYGANSYSVKSFITNKSFADMYKLAQNVGENHSTDVFVLEAKITSVETQYYGNYYISNPDNSDESIILYAGSGKTQYAWLADYVGETVTIEVALCNWNKKDIYGACVLAVRLSDGTKVLNTLNFNN